MTTPRQSQLHRRSAPHTEAEMCANPHSARRSKIKSDCADQQFKQPPAAPNRPRTSRRNTHGILFKARSCLTVQWLRSEVRRSHDTGCFLRMAHLTNLKRTNGRKLEEQPSVRLPWIYLSAILREGGSDPCNRNLMCGHMD